MKYKKITSKLDIKPADKEEGYLIDADEKTIRSILASLKQRKISKKIAVLGREDDFNRRMVEKTEIDFLVSPERGKRVDSLKQRDSGLNHVIAKEATKRGIGIVIDFNDICEIKDKKEKALRLGRIMQNIKICRKAGCKILIWDFSKKAEKPVLRAWGFSLGMSSQQVSEGIE